MSKFVEKLERVSREEAPPMGFAAAAKRTKAPPFLLIALLGQAVSGEMDQAAKEGADAILLTAIPTADQLAQIKEEMGQVTWGLWLNEGGLDLKGLFEAGCDFLVFGADETPSSVLLEEELGRAMVADASQSDSALRAIDQIPVDAVLVKEKVWPGDKPLTVAQIMAMAGQSDAIIYTLGLFEPDDPDRNPGVLKRLARATGGEAFLPGSVQHVVPICEQIARDIRNQYTIGYKPSNPQAGGYRSVRVEVRAKGYKNLQVRTRSGYYATQRQASK